MRQRIQIFAITILVLLLTFITIISSLYNSNWAKQKDDKSIAVVQSNNELTDEYKFAYMICGDGKDFGEILLENKESDGEVLLKLYPYDNLEKIDNKSISSLLKKKPVKIVGINNLENVRIDITEYINPNVIIVLELPSNTKNAKINTTCYLWNNNWNSFLDEIGLRRIKKIEIDEIRKK